VIKKSLVKSLFLSYLWITLAAVVLVGLYGAHIVRQVYLDRTAQDLEARARLCERPVLELLAQEKWAEVDAICKELGKSTGTRMGDGPDPFRLTVILPSGRVVGDTEEDPRRMENHKDRPEIREAAAGSVGRSLRYSATLKEELMYVGSSGFRCRTRGIRPLAR